jgi:SAM-dependent methyltransferase
MTSYSADADGRWNRENLIGLALGVVRSVLLQQGVVSGLFGELRDPVPAERIARSHGWREAECGRFLDALVALGVLAVEGDAYRLAADCAPYLDEQEPEYVGENIRHMWLQRGLWRDIHRVLAAAEPLPDQQDLSMTVDRERLVTLLRTMRRLTDEVVPYVAGMPVWDTCRDVLDVAGGHGELLAAIARHRPVPRGTVVDQPYAEEEAAVTFRQHGMAERLGFAVRDLTVDGALAGMAADAVLLARCLHNFDAERIRGILRSARDALRSGGHVVVIENYLGQDDGAMVPPQSAIFSAYMAVNCAGGHVPTTEWMTAEFDALGAELTVDRFSDTFVAYTARW